MLTTNGKSNEEEIGRVKTIWVTDQSNAVISSLIAEVIQKKNLKLTPELKFKGDVKISKTIQRHLSDVVLTHTNNILGSLSLPLQSFTLSALNIGAALSYGIGVSISGSSIDLSVFLALISSALNIPIRQDIAFTGHIGSSDGDILPVAKIPEKCEATIKDKNIHVFVYPDIDSDLSLQTMTPKEYERTTIALRKARGKIKLHPVKNTLELFKKVIDPRAIVLGALRSDFFYNKEPLKSKRIQQTVAQLLNHANKKRFWNSLEQCIFERKYDPCHELINEWIEYFIRKKQYPQDFGKQLLQLMISIPNHLQRDKQLFPLLVKEKYIQLIQYAEEKDYDDVTFLHDSLYADLSFKNEHIVEKKKISKNITSIVLQHIIQQLDPDYIEKEITQPYDQARASYTTDSIIVKNNDQFIDIVLAFYTHLYRHVNKIKGIINKNDLSADALDYLEKTFKSENGYKEALSLAMDGTKGGLRYIFDQVTDYMKEEATIKHTLRTFKENINPLDYELKLEIIKQIMKHYSEFVSEDALSEPPEKYVENYEELIQVYVKSKHGLQSLLQSL